MTRFFYLFILFLCPFSLLAQQNDKKPLDHTVYDNWQSIGERLLSNDGKWVVYTVTPQEGDGTLMVKRADNSSSFSVPRGYNAAITPDSRFLVFRIRPFFKDTRQARIKKKKPEEMPKDSLGIMELGKDSILKIARVRAYKSSDKNSGWMAYQLDRPDAPEADKTKKPANNVNAQLDSLKRLVDSLSKLVLKKKKDEDGYTDIAPTDAEGDDPAVPKPEEGFDLVVYQFADGKKTTYNHVNEFYFNKNGDKLLLKTSSHKKDSLSKPAVSLVNLPKDRVDIIARGFNDAKGFAMDESGTQVAFLAERDSSIKALQRFYKIWYYNGTKDSSTILVDMNIPGMKPGWTVSENGNLSFSKTGNRLFFGTAPKAPPRDTNQVEIDLVKIDIWHYKDDYLQTQQLRNAEQEKKRSYTTVYDFSRQLMVMLGDKEIPQVIQTNEGDGELFVGITDIGKRISAQWEGATKKDIYAINPTTGSRQLVKKDLSGQVFASAQGKYIVWYDNKSKNYFSWSANQTRNLTGTIKISWADEENDVPDDADPYGITGWHENDQYVYINDRYDIWRIDPSNGANAPVRITNGRLKKVTYNYLRTNPEERFIKTDQSMLMRVFDQTTKESGLVVITASNKNEEPGTVARQVIWKASIAGINKARNADAYLFTKETYTESPNLHYTNDLVNFAKLSDINQQQATYNWGTASLYNWKTFSGKTSEGILYKPENFDPAKKYPIIFYFYERLANTLYQYQAPSPTPSRLNISFFVSRGYLVFAPDIRYTNGYPGRSAYDYIGSAARTLGKEKWVDSTRMGIQGQSWGGYQVAHLVTVTNMFRAAWAGAPVANMTSAYGGIRWESGLNRQFQYEKTQSRIGASLWEKPELYIENSPLFRLPKVNTPLVIMSNDNDGAVPWYQGIELFTGLRRLGKPVWLLNYNGEAHNLVERKNRKDIQIREQQFFDWLLKGEKPAKWITEGVPATEKGKSWGLE
jgi:dipeptidyl aminopeptidase/acylaminoacyl peptidase